MYIDLYFDIDGNEIMHAYGIVPILSRRLFIIDTCTLFPAIFSRKKRNVNEVEKYTLKLHPLSDKRSKIAVRAEIREHAKHCIELTNLIEDGKLRKRNIYPGITIQVFKELEKLNNTCRGNLDEWINSVKNSIYVISLPIKELRENYDEISDTFGANGDFSVAMASLLLGCDFISDDYNSFNQKSIRLIKKRYKNRWKKVLTRYDAQSFLEKLDEIEFKH